jgi:hypothetical protein
VIFLLVARGDGVLEGDKVIKLTLQVTAELVHAQVVGIITEGVLNLATDALHTKERERHQAHNRNSQPSQGINECEWKSQAVQVHDLTPIVQGAKGKMDVC